MGVNNKPSEVYASPSERHAPSCDRPRTQNAQTSAGLGGVDSMRVARKLRRDSSPDHPAQA